MGARATVPVFTLMVLLTAADPSSAQTRPAPSLDLSVGWTGFADDGIVSETPVGAAVRWYVTPRLSIGPEFTHIVGDTHTHQVLTGNLTFDFVTPRSGRVVPFVVAGAGLFRTSQSFFQESFNSTEGAFTAGGGLRYVATDRLSLGIDARMGWEPHIRVTGLVSIGLGRTP
jgi:hypothetical protein